MPAEDTCSVGTTLVFACSGAADVGAVADRAARKLTEDSLGQMFCLAGIGGRVEPIMQKTASAPEILAIDGCQLDCAKSCLEQAGFHSFRHMRVTDLGMGKGKTPVSDEAVLTVAREAAGVLGRADS